MGLKLRWLLLLSCLYISVEAHAYGYRPQQHSYQPSSHIVKLPSTYSYVRPAARGISPQQPAVKYVSPSVLPAVPKYASAAAVPKYPASTAVPPVATASYKSGDYATGTPISTTTAAPYTADVVYYTTEPVYYTTTPPSYYAEHIYYSTELPAGSGTTESPYYTGSQYTYVDAGTYFGEDVAQQYTESPAAVYAAPTDYVPAAVPGDYIPAGPGDYAPAVPPDYATAVEAHYMDAAGTIPAYYPYTDSTEYYAVATGTEQYAQNLGYYTESAPVYAGSVPVYDVQQNYVAGSEVYVTDVPVYSNEYTTAFSYYANLAPDSATFSSFGPANVQYVA